MSIKVERHKIITDCTESFKEFFRKFDASKLSHVAAEDLEVNDLVKLNENGTVSLADSSYIYVDGEQKNYATLEADNAALKEEVEELRLEMAFLKIVHNEPLEAAEKAALEDHERKMTEPYKECK